MIRILLFTLALLYLAIPARSQEVAIRSGQHEDFTRLTLSLPTRIGWSVTSRDSQARVRFAEDTLRLDTERVFDRIPRDRIANIAWDDATRTLVIDFACVCELSGFWHGASLLVFDIRQRDGPEDADGNANPPDLALPEKPASHAAGLALDGMRNTGIDTGQSTQGQQNISGVLVETRARLVQQFGRAASQGLLDLKDPTPGPTPRPTGNREEPAPVSPVRADAIDQPVPMHLRAQSSIDMALTEYLRGAVETVTARECIADRRIDIASWGTGAPFGEQLAQHRKHLLGEFDTVDRAIALDLARLYIFFTFGAEAQSTLNMLPRDDTEVAVLAQLAEIADLGHSIGPSLLADQLHCDSLAALWSTLSYRELPRDRAINTDAVLRHFSALPPHMRDHFGPTLSRRFLDAGQAKAGDAILTILDRRGVPDTPDETLAKAEHAAASGAEAQATRNLERLASGTSPVAAEALAQLIETRTNRGEPVTVEQADLVAAYAVELNNDALAPRLRAAHIRALAGSGAFTEAFDRLAADAEARASAEVSKLQADLLRLLSDHADDVTFLEHTLGETPDHLTDLSPEIVSRLSHRLIGLGFPDAAARFLSAVTPATPDLLRDWQLMRARIALQHDKPRLALVELIDLEGNDAALLRARALSEAGDHSAAFHLYKTMERDEDARRQAWLDGDWRNATDPDEPAYESLAQITDERNDPSLAETVTAETLGPHRRLVEESEAIRATSLALIAANPAPTEDIVDP